MGGASIAAVTEEASVEAIVDAANTLRGHWTITANLDHLRRYRQDPLARQLMDAADLVVADGMPLIWASKLAGTPLPERVAGSSMIWSICEQARQRGQSIYLLGGDPGVAQRAAHVLSERYPGIEVAGTICPPYGFERDEAELEHLSRSVAAADPRIVFVALGFPKQDLLIRLLRCALPDASFVGVGISLSFVAGEVSRAPAWMRRLGFEWLYRLAQDPRRLARRYLVAGVPFVCRLLTAALLHRLGDGSAAGDTRGSGWGWDTREPDLAAGFSEQHDPVPSDGSGERSQLRAGGERPRRLPLDQRGTRERDKRPTTSV